jgi:hypothetical protein
MLLLPLALLTPLIATAWVWIRRDAGRKSRTVEAAIAFTSLVLTIAFCRWDPHRVVMWFMD